MLLASYAIQAEVRVVAASGWMVETGGRGWMVHMDGYNNIIITPKTVL